MLWTIMGEGADGMNYMPTAETLKLFDGPLTKRELERLQCEKYRELLIENFPQLKFEIDSVPDRDPPDFMVTRGDEIFGMDMKAFALQDRRDGGARLEHLRSELLAIFRRGGLRRCRGLIFHVHFDIINNTGKLKIPSNLRQAAPQLAAAFSRMTVFPEPPVVYPTTNLEHEKRISVFQQEFSVRNKNFCPPYSIEERGDLPEFGLGWYVSGCIRHPKNDFEIETGIGLEFDFNQSLSTRDIKQLLDEAIASHDGDDQAIDELVVIAGGPDTLGQASNDESVFVTAFFDAGLKIDTPKNIKRVAIIEWLHRKIWLAYGFPEG